MQERQTVLSLERATQLIYELIDAHDDTTRLAEGQPLDLHWRAHLAYLRDLQRVAREELARLTPSEIPAERN